ncbi:MAG: 1-acyl-sn-glycerol-3-phosphate acyltransferase [Dysgonamonadaceae bacterium]|nr:1-acyl-sn-glycerol-3-phosphate acyltransferase [Dysgonamonadaceae bacterium]
MEIKKEGFDDIRPFYDDEIPSVIAKLVTDPQFQRVVEVNLHQMNWEELKSLLLTFKRKYDFQNSIIKPAVFALLAGKSGSVDCTGFENVPQSEAYTYISNHRDIVLDAAILCVLLLNIGYDTCEICLGDNLLAQPWITELVRLNKGIIVKRGVGTRQQYEVSKQLSEYIHFAINEEKQSVWLAQREGRAKNSDDKTQLSVLKMLSLGGGKDFLESISKVNIVPISLSYEFDPCDYLKAAEFQSKRDNPDYKKAPADDLKNMETGILGYKGNIHFQIGRPINPFISQIDKSIDKNEQIAQVAAIIDKEIYLNYRFYPINYVAYDKLWGKGDFFKSKYTEDDLKEVENYFQQQLDKINIPNKDIPFLTEKLLEMYAFPVKNHLDALEHV